MDRRTEQYPQVEPRHKTRPRWPSIVLAAIGAFLAWRAYSGGSVWLGAGAVILLLLAFLLNFRELWKWLGFGEKGEKTGLDLIQVLAALSVPIMVAIVGYQVSESQNRSRLDAEQQRAQDEALQTYLDQMGSLLLDEGLLSSKEDDEVRTLARARTLTILGRVDGARKRSVVQFLHESGLIRRGPERGGIVGNEPSIVSLRDADLSYADLSNMILYEPPKVGDPHEAGERDGDDLQDVDLSGADLTGTFLKYADLHSADLSGADLSGADLSHADLQGADLSYANLSETQILASMEDIILGHDGDLEKKASSLKGATMPDGSQHD